jgi:pimeloyl-ACP methyl ester carboxylesterase
VRISMAQNIDPADPAASTMLVHGGGPFPSLSFGATTQQGTPELRATTNYVSFDQRGLGQSSIVECDYEHDPADGATAELEAIGATCSADPALATMTTEQVAYDMDFIRHLLGLDQVSYLGYSYGTWLGTWFGALFPDNIERMVLDSAIDGTSPTYETSWTAQDVAIDRQLRLLVLNWLARNDDTVGLGDDPEVIWDRYFAATDTPGMRDAAYIVWGASGAATAQSKPVAIEFVAEVMARLVEEGETGGTGDAIERATRVIDSLTVPDDAKEGMLVQFAIYADSAVTETPGIFSSADDYYRCLDGGWTQGAAHWEDYNERMAAEAPFSAQLRRFDAPPICAFWPTDVRMPAADDSFPETIVVQSELDPLTPWEQGERMGTSLPNSSLIAVDDEGVHGVFPYGTEEVDRPVLDFLLGEADRPADTIYGAAKPLPLDQETFAAWTELGGADRDEPGFTDPFQSAPTGVVVPPEE